MLLKSIQSTKELNEIITCDFAILVGQHLKYCAQHGSCSLATRFQQWQNSSELPWTKVEQGYAYTPNLLSPQIGLVNHFYWWTDYSADSSHCCDKRRFIEPLERGDFAGNLQDLDMEPSNTIGNGSFHFKFWSSNSTSTSWTSGVQDIGGVWWLGTWCFPAGRHAWHQGGLLLRQHGGIEEQERGDLLNQAHLQTEGNLRHPRLLPVPTRVTTKRLPVRKLCGIEVSQSTCMHKRQIRAKFTKLQAKCRDWLSPYYT